MGLMEKIVGLFLITFLGLGIVGIVMECRQENRLFKECLKDHKEYECYGIMRGRR